MDRSQNYERVFKKKLSPIKLIFVYLGYVLLSAAAVLLILWTLNPYISVLAVTAAVLIIVLTHKYTRVELEYEFMGGIFTVSHIYGKSRRRVICEVELSDCVSIDFATEEKSARALHPTPEKVYDARSSADAKDVIVAVWEEAKNERYVIFFEYDERTLVSLFKANAQACSLEIRTKAR